MKKLQSIPTTDQRNLINKLQQSFSYLRAFRLRGKLVIKGIVAVCTSSGADPDRFPPFYGNRSDYFDKYKVLELLRNQCNIEIYVDVIIPIREKWVSKKPGHGSSGSRNLKSVFGGKYLWIPPPPPPPPPRKPYQLTPLALVLS